LWFNFNNLDITAINNTTYIRFYSLNNEYRNLDGVNTPYNGQIVFDIKVNGLDYYLIFSSVESYSNNGLILLGYGTYLFLIQKRTDHLLPDLNLMNISIPELNIDYTFNNFNLYNPGGIYKKYDDAGQINDFNYNKHNSILVENLINSNFIFLKPRDISSKVDVTIKFL